MPAAAGRCWSTGLNPVLPSSLGHTLSYEPPKPRLLVYTALEHPEAPDDSGRGTHIYTRLTLPKGSPTSVSLPL